MSKKITKSKLNEVIRREIRKATEKAARKQRLTEAVRKAVRSALLKEDKEVDAFVKAGDLSLNDYVALLKKIANDKEFQAVQAGGRLVPFDDSNIIFSTGDYRSRYLAQDINSVNGKLIKINLKNGKYKIISMGHRNPQGLYLDKENNFLLATELIKSITGEPK